MLADVEHREDVRRWSAAARLELEAAQARDDFINVPSRKAIRSGFPISMNRGQRRSVSRAATDFTQFSAICTRFAGPASDVIIRKRPSGPTS